MSLHSQSWKKLTAVASFAAVAGFLGGTIFQDKKIRKANAAIATYPGNEFLREFERYVKHLEYDDDFSGSDFELNAWLYCAGGDAKILVERWGKQFEATLTPRYGAEEWSKADNCGLGQAVNPFPTEAPDFNQPLLKIGFYIPYGEGGACCAVVDRSNRWIRFRSYWSD